MAASSSSRGGHMTSSRAYCSLASAGSKCDVAITRPASACKSRGFESRSFWCAAAACGHRSCLEKNEAAARSSSGLVAPSKHLAASSVCPRRSCSAMRVPTTPGRWRSPPARRSVARAFSGSLACSCSWASVSRAATGLLPAGCDASATLAATSSASTHCFGCLARCRRAARTRSAVGELGNSPSSKARISLHWSGLFMCSARSAVLHKNASRCGGVSFLASVSDRFALFFFHESKRSRWPRMRSMLLAATASTAGSRSALKAKRVS
mmetsp:Transcript_21877/g.55838  ORF Transcript_21877/g.55838 Transcript_21877/m.55838 type:complete len:267 (+) Transcript_21877:789-1589(+)